MCHEVKRVENPWSRDLGSGNDTQSHVPQQTPQSGAAPATLGKLLNRMMSQHGCQLGIMLPLPPSVPAKWLLCPVLLSPHSSVLQQVSYEAVSHKATVAHCTAFLHRNVTGPTLFRGWPCPARAQDLDQVRQPPGP